MSKELTHLEQEMLAALKIAETQLCYSVGAQNPTLIDIRKLISKAEPPKPQPQPPVNFTWNMLNNRNHHNGCICSMCEAIRNGSIRIVPDAPKIEPRRWLVEFEDSPQSEMVGVFKTTRSISVIREVKPIKRKDIESLRYLFQPLPQTGIEAVLESLGIEVED
jgi:hypothetical protein